MKNIIVFSLILFIASSPTAWAYVDPSSGSLLLQVIIASIVGVTMFFKNIRLAIIQFFNKKSKNNSQS